MTYSPSAQSATPFDSKSYFNNPLEIVITAGRKPDSINNEHTYTDIITQAEIKRRQITDTITLLHQINGLTVNRAGGKGSTASVVLRGTRTAQTLVLVDGVRMNSAASGTPALEAIPIESIERIEVVKGPLSSLYGPDAMGGVIHIITRRGETRQAGAQISAMGGSFGTRRYHASSQIGGQKRHAYLSMTHENSKGFDAVPKLSVLAQDDVTPDLDPFKQRAGNLSAVAFLTDVIRSEINYLYSDNVSHFDLYPSGQSDLFDARTTTRLEIASARLIGTPNAQTELTVEVGYNQEQSQTVSDLIYTIHTTRRSLNARASFRFTPQLNTQFGVDHSLDTLNALDDTAPFSEDKRKTTGLFSQWRWTSGAIDITVSGRTDTDDTDYNHTSNNRHSTGTIILGHRLTDQTRATVRYGTAFHAPTFNELYYPGFGNPTLQPETSTSIELALHSRRHNTSWHHASWHTAIFQTHIKNIIGYDSDFRRINQDRAEIEGAEFSISSPLPYNTQWYANLAYTDARDASTQTPLDFRPTVTFTSGASWQHHAFTWGVDVEIIRGRRIFGERSPSYSLTGAHAAYQFNRQISVSAKGENLGDRAYIENYFAPNVPYHTAGRTFLFGVTIQLL
ncbi:MAG: TonB-dependent receptor [Gammaproteobacteria bacterium]